MKQFVEITKFPTLAKQWEYLSIFTEDYRALLYRSYHFELKECFQRLMKDSNIRKLAGIYENEAIFEIIVDNAPVYKWAQDKHDLDNFCRWVVRSDYLFYLFTHPEEIADRWLSTSYMSDDTILDYLDEQGNFPGKDVILKAESQYLENCKLALKENTSTPWLIPEPPRFFDAETDQFIEYERSYVEKTDTDQEKNVFEIYDPPKIFNDGKIYSRN